jgi:hypothetical protein
VPHLAATSRSQSNSAVMIFWVWPAERSDSGPRNGRQPGEPLQERDVLEKLVQSPRRNRRTYLPCIPEQPLGLGTVWSSVVIASRPRPVALAASQRATTASSNRFGGRIGLASRFEGRSGTGG